MKVSINYEVVNRIWGGGNKFVISLIDQLKKNNHDVIHHLNDNDIDIILIIDPRKHLKNIKYGAGAVQRYIWLKNKKAIVVHRINECDERKNTKFMNLLLRMTNDCADHTVFVGTWLKKLKVWNRNDQQASVILNGSNKDIFNSKKSSLWNNKKILKIVTHHWSSNINKGFDIYKYLDDLLDKKKWKKRIEFTYVGNIPKNFKFRNTNLIEPKKDNELSVILKNNHIYLTASINEPGGNHQNEGGMCGLPLLYRDSGCMQEYCEGFGVSFHNKKDFLDSLNIITKNYPIFKSKMKDFNRDINTTTKSYIKLFNLLIYNKNEIIKKRRYIKNPLKILFNLLIN